MYGLMTVNIPEPMTDFAKFNSMVSKVKSELRIPSDIHVELELILVASSYNINKKVKPIFRILVQDDPDGRFGSGLYIKGDTWQLLSSLYNGGWNYSNRVDTLTKVFCRKADYQRSGRPGPRVQVFVCVDHISTDFRVFSSYRTCERLRSRLSKDIKVIREQEEAEAKQLEKAISEPKTIINKPNRNPPQTVEPRVVGDDRFQLIELQERLNKLILGEKALIANAERIKRNINSLQRDLSVNDSSLLQTQVEIEAVRHQIKEKTNPVQQLQELEMLLLQTVPNDKIQLVRDYRKLLTQILKKAR